MFQNKIVEPDSSGSKDKRAVMAIQLHHFGASTLKHADQNKQLIFTTAKSKSLQINAKANNARQLIQSGAIQPFTPKEAAAAMKGGFVLLDIRPMWETEKARVKGSLHVPLFVEDKDYSAITLLKKWVHFGYIGLWTGQKFTMFNPNFVRQVVAAVPDKDSKLLVACGEGLR